MRSSGALVWRARNGKKTFDYGERINPSDIEVLLVHRPRYDDWSWPKGKAEVDEPLLVAGAREVEEETGVVVTMGAPLTTQRYRLGSGHIKEVHYWVGRPVEAPGVRYTRLPVTPASVKEIDETRWVKPDKARELLTRRGDRHLLDELTTRARRGELLTTTVAVVRHAAAVPRSAWEDGERTRPLGRTGGRQALALVDILSALGTQRLVSSSWARCQATLAPYAALLSERTLAMDDLTERAWREEPKAASRVVKKLVRRPGDPVAVCSHRPVLPALFSPLLKASSNQLRRDFPAEDPFLRTGEVLVAHLSHVDGEAKVVAVQRHRPITAPAD